MKATELKKMVDALLDEGGVKKMEQYRSAVPTLFEMDEAIANAKDWVKKLVESRNALSESAAAYAIDHPTALDEPITVDKEGIQSGMVDIDGIEYRLTISSEAPKRISGGNMTKEFLKSLPAEWTQSKLALAVSALKGLATEELEKHDLYRPVKRVWSIGK